MGALSDDDKTVVIGEPMPDGKNGWDEHKRMVLDHLERNEQQHESIFQKFEALNRTLSDHGDMIAREIRDGYVTKDRFGPVEKVAYGLIAIIAAGVGLWLLEMLRAAVK